MTGRLNGTEQCAGEVFGRILVPLEDLDLGRLAMGVKVDYDQ